MELTSAPEHIKDTSTYGTILTGNWQNSYTKQDCKKDTHVTG